MASSQVTLKVGSCSDLHARAGPFDVDVVCSAYCRRARSTVSFFSHRHDSQDLSIRSLQAGERIVR